MREVRRESLRDLLRLDDGQILAVTQHGDRYWLVNDSTGSTESITTQAAALLWQHGQRESWERLDQTAGSRRSNDLFGAAAADGSESSRSFRERLRERLAMIEDE